MMGLSAAWINHDIRSRDMKSGLIRKGVLSVSLWTLHLTANLLLPQIDPTFANPYIALEMGITTSFIINEAISLIENAGLAGIQVPDWLSTRFRQLQADQDNLMNGEKVKDEVAEQRAKD